MISTNLRQKLYDDEQTSSTMFNLMINAWNEALAVVLICSIWPVTAKDKSNGLNCSNWKQALPRQ